MGARPNKTKPGLEVFYKSKKRSTLVATLYGKKSIAQQFLMITKHPTLGIWIHCIFGNMYILPTFIHTSSSIEFNLPGMQLGYSNFMSTLVPWPV